MNSPPHPKPADWAGIATLGLVWGATFLVIEIALRGITPFWLAAARIGFAAALMAVVWGLRGFRLFHVPAPSRVWRALAVIAMLSSAVPFMLLSWGQQSVTSGFAGISMATVAIMVLPMAHFAVPGEHLSWRKVAGFVIGFGGVVLLAGGDAFASSGAAEETAGRLACLAAAACYATSSVMMRRLPPVDAVGLAAVLMLIGAAGVIPMALAVEGTPVMPDGQTLAALAVLGLLPTAAANFLRVAVIRSAGPTFMSLTNYVVPVISVLLGGLILAEPFPPQLAAAFALVLVGMGLSQWGALSRLFSPTSRS